jgi:hypothetical protein
VKAIAEDLEHMSKPESAEAIRTAITMVTDHTASDAAHFTPANWP